MMTDFEAKIKQLKKECLSRCNQQLHKRVQGNYIIEVGACFYDFPIFAEKKQTKKEESIMSIQSTKNTIFQRKVGRK